MGREGPGTRNQTFSAGRNRRSRTGVRFAGVAGPSLSHRRNFSQRQAIDRRALIAKSPFELAQRKIAIGPSNNCKAGTILGETSDLVKIIGLISGDPEKPLRRERAMNRVEKT